LGSLVGRFEGGDTLVCEDAALTSSSLKYSLVAAKDSFVWMYQASESIKEWPIEMKERLLNIAEKKYWIPKISSMKLEKQVYTTGHNPTRIEL
jgi:hypothetical protein